MYSSEHQGNSNVNKLLIEIEYVFIASKSFSFINPELLLISKLSNSKQIFLLISIGKISTTFTEKFRNYLFSF